MRSKARWLAREKDAVRGWLGEKGYLAGAGAGEGEASRDSAFAQPEDV